MDNTITDALSQVNTALQAQINPGVVAGVIGLVLAGCIALFLTWFGIRKLVGAIVRALKGHLSV